MIQKNSFIILILSLGLLSCKQSSSTGLKGDNDSTKIILDSIIYNNYLKAIDNESTFSLFLVVTINDLNTGQKREICTRGDFLEGALHIEYKIKYDSLGLAELDNIQRNNKSRYFELKDTAALNNLGFYNYTIEDLTKFEKGHNIDSVVQLFKNGKSGLDIPDDKIMLLYAHSLFNRGILTGENICFGGRLIYAEDNWLNERKEQHLDIKRKMALIRKDKK